MDILKLLKEYAKNNPEHPACLCGETVMTYGELDRLSDGIADWLVSRFGDSRAPVVVYGHKQPLMIASFLGCSKAGKAYCPLDISMPPDRVDAVIKKSGASAVFAVEKMEQAEKRIEGGPPVIGYEELSRIAESGSARSLEEYWLTDDDIVYIIFTSGSTGEPKGVQISCAALSGFTDWSVNLGSPAEKKRGVRFLNQAPFSFDLSVMDLYTCLAVGGTLCPLTKEVQNSYGLLFDALKSINPSVWVSTPSFAELCLADPGFQGSTLPALRTFLFCGERLTNGTALKLIKRFPEAEVINTYGPTESTVAVTDVRITEELCQADENLPVGRPKDGCTIYIINEAGMAADGEPGEIVITGSTLSAGYLGDPAQTERAFRMINPPGSSSLVRAYFTGDEGYTRDGMLYFNGRLDQQVKLHGYRIELGDIESNLLKIPGVNRACVLPVMRDGRTASLTAAVCCSEHVDKGNRAAAKEIREALRTFLPDYMIPKKIVFLDSMPMTQNGKTDRKAVMELIR